MTSTTRTVRFLTLAALLTGTILVAGCGSSDKVTRTSTTETTTTTTPPVAASSSTTTTTTQQTRP
jgi:outer membrane murein-binding lipoprotein Lpp